ncbi:MAG: hypothetical protein IKG58_03005 [Bacilli bacterium]|nr:hypothetical protein [Bacilli bacterium]MBR3049506.1 hypothetical protein [Bacilli bacterium]
MKEKCINSKDIKKRELKLAKEEYKNLTKFVDIELDRGVALAAKHYTGLGISYICSGSGITYGIASGHPEVMIASGSIFALTLVSTGIEIFGGPRKERQEYLKPIKKAKKEYKEMYKTKKHEIEANYLENKAKEKILIKK